MRVKKLLKQILPFSLGILIISTLVSEIGFSTILINSRKISPISFIFFIIILLLTVSTKAFRWTLLIKNFAGISLDKASMIYLIGQAMNEIFPYGSGELLKMYFVKKISRVSFLTPSSAIFFERLFDLALLLVFSSIGIFMLSDEFGLGFERVNFVLFFVFLLVLIFALILIKPQWIRKLLNISYGDLKNQSLDLLEKYETGRAKISNKIIFTAFSLTLLAWILESFLQYLLIAAFGFSIKLPLIVPIVAISTLVGVFSFIPGGLGVREVTFAFLLSLVGIPFEIGSSIAIFYRSFIYVINGIFGGVSFYFLTKHLSH